MIIFRSILAIFRLVLFFIVTVVLFSILLFTNLFYNNEAKKIERGMLYRRSIIRLLNLIVGSKIITYGVEPKKSGLIISNHRSYFDSIVILKNILAFPIAKKEVASWPVIGNVCKSSGVIFVHRENKKSRKKTVEKVATVLENGFSILNTPEGTTHIKPTTIDFKPGAFAMAAQLNVPVIPIAIDYKNLNDAFIDDDTFVPHFIRCFGKWKTEIKVSYLQPILSDSMEELITQSKVLIDNELIRFRNDWS